MSHRGRDSGIDPGDNPERVNLDLDDIPEGGNHGQDEGDNVDENAENNDGGDGGEVPPAVAPAAQAVNMAQVSGSQLVTIPTFSGEEGVYQIKNFIAHVSRAQTQFGWTEVQTVTSAQSRLTDQAQTWLRGATITGKTWNRWTPGAAGADGVVAETFQDALNKRFGRVLTSALAVDAVQDLNQRDLESVSRFYDRVLLALDRKNYIYSEADKREDNYKRAFNHDLITFFLGGLRENIRRRVLGSAAPPETPENALAAARAAEAEINKNNPVKMIEAVQANPGRVEAQGAQGSTSMVRYEVCDLTGDKIPVPVQVDAVKMQNRELICWRCGGKGHFAANCATPAAGDGNRGRGKGRGRGRGRGRGGRGGFRQNAAVEQQDNDSKQGDDQSQDPQGHDPWLETESQGNAYGE